MNYKTYILKKYSRRFLNLQPDHSVGLKSQQILPAVTWTIVGREHSILTNNTTLCYVNCWRKEAQDTDFNTTLTPFRMGRGFRLGQRPR